jgi:urease beta subunit
MPLALPISNIEINQAKNKEMKKTENLLEREINKGSHHPL